MKNTSTELFNNKIRNMYGLNNIDKRKFDLSNLHSSYWLRQLPTGNVDLITLASYRRAIARFVRIATKKEIPVIFSSGNMSYTDSTEVVLSAKIKNSEFDCAVGLALHESYHIKDTDFSAIEKFIGYDKHLKTCLAPLPSILEKDVNRLNINKNNAMALIKDYFNFIEDRRIDSISYNDNPGYQMYYQALYAKYFCNDLVDKALQSNLFRAPLYLNENNEFDPLGAYNFRIFNIVNQYTDLDALPGLRDIWKALDLNTIVQLNNTTNSFKLAIKIVHLILSNIQTLGNPNASKKNKKDSSDKSFESDIQDLLNKMGGKPNDESGISDLPNMDGVSNDGSNNSNNNSENFRELSKKEKEDLKKFIEKLKDFVDGNINKEKLNASDKSIIDAIDKSGMTFEKVGRNDKINKSENNQNIVNVLVVRNLNKEILKSLSGLNYRHGEYSCSKVGVERGLQLGRLLASRLQIRNDTKYFYSKRKSAGKLDKRMLYNIGMNNTDIFERVRKDSYGEAIVHISIDASGSMDGEKWENALTSAVGIAYASDKVKNLDVIISFRSTEPSGASMVIGYDSRRDDFSKIKSLFPMISPNGMTPEGICFESIMKDILASVQGKTGYFINLSDGLPNMGAGGMSPVDLTRNAIDKMRNAGIHVLSFLIEELNHAESEFRKMYGKDARLINVTSLIPLAKELNKMFSTTK